MSIDEHPGIVDQREYIGIWELDTIIGKRRRQAIVTLAERELRFALLRMVERHKANLECDAVIDLLQPLADRVHTIPGDNGNGFAELEPIPNKLDIDFFFTHPYAAWKRGVNENMNGLVRQYIPKNRDFALVTDEKLIKINDKLNHRPRNCLGFRTPYEVLFEQPVALTC